MKMKHPVRFVLFLLMALGFNVFAQKDELNYTVVLNICMTMF